ncbi:MAG: DUF456 family protein [Pseudomonadota bacterium]
MQFRIVLMAALLSSTSVAAPADTTASKQETTGAGAGLIIGAAAGGPVGAILGAAVGAKLGDTLHSRNERADALSADLKGAEARVAALQSDISTLDRSNDALLADVQKLETLARPELIALLNAGIEMELLFRTDEDVLNERTNERISQLAAALGQLPDILIRLDGFADKRGDAEYNRGLSLRRVEGVKDVLVAAGVPASRIQVHAHGESESADDSADSYALQRKVSVTLFVDDSRSFASSPSH